MGICKQKQALHLMACSVVQLASAAVKLSKAALMALDLRGHRATHPRLGVVDHISCHPVGASAHLSDAAELATELGNVQMPLPTIGT